MHSRQAAAAAAEKLVIARAGQFMTQKREQGAAATVMAYRQQAESLRLQETQRALASLQKGADPAEVLERFGRGLTNKLLHAPSLALKKAAAAGEMEKLSWAAELLGLPDADEGAAAAPAAGAPKAGHEGGDAA